MESTIENDHRHGDGRRAGGGGRGRARSRARRARARDEQEDHHRGQERQHVARLAEVDERVDENLRAAASKRQGTTRWGAHAMSPEGTRAPGEHRERERAEADDDGLDDVARHPEGHVEVAVEDRRGHHLGNLKVCARPREVGAPRPPVSQIIGTNHAITDTVSTAETDEDHAHVGASRTRSLAEPQRKQQHQRRLPEAAREAEVAGGEPRRGGRPPRNRRGTRSTTIREEPKASPA